MIARFIQMKNNMRDWLRRGASTVRAQYILGVISFAESSFFPIPPDFFLIPMILACREKWLRLSTITALSSMAGAFLGYVIGIALLHTVAEPLINLYNLQGEMQKIGEFFGENAFWAIFISGFGPIPFKVFTIGAGIFKVNIWTFSLAVITGRGIRFWFEGFVLGKLSNTMADRAFRIFNWGTMALVIALVLYIILK